MRGQNWSVDTSRQTSQYMRPIYLNKCTLDMFLICGRHVSYIEVDPVLREEGTSCGTSSLLAILPPYHPPLYNGTHTKMSAPTSHHCSGTRSTCTHQQGPLGNNQALTGAQNAFYGPLLAGKAGHMTCHGTPATKYSPPLLSSPLTLFLLILGTYHHQPRTPTWSH